MVRFKMITVLALTLWLTLSCDGDLRDIPECYVYEECAEDQICVQLGDNDEIVKYGSELLNDGGGACVSIERCHELPNLRQELRRAYGQPDADGVISLPNASSALEPCIEGEPIGCANDGTYRVCKWRDTDSNLNSGCHFYLPSFPEAYPEITWEAPPEETCAQGGACSEEGGVSCIPACDSNSDCEGGAVCRNSERNSVFTCNTTHEGPTADSMCTLTIIDAVVDGFGVEGIQFNDPDLYVVLTVGAREEKTGIAEGTTSPTWNHEFPELPWAQLAQMKLVLWDDDVSIIWQNNDDFVFEWDTGRGQWWAPSLEHTFTLSGGPVERLTAQLSCRSSS